MAGFFEAILYQPIYNFFVVLYNHIPDAGAVIFILTVVIKAFLFPLTKKSIEAQKSLTALQPKMEELKEKYKDNQQAMAQATMQLYKEHKVNPVGSCLPILIQLPVFLALYWVLRDVLASERFDVLYSFVANPGTINPMSLGVIDLATPSIVLAAMAAAAQFWQAKMMQSRRPPKAAKKGGKDEGMASMMNKQMLYFMPGFTFIIGVTFPGGLALYWFLSTFITGLQQWIMFRDKKNGSDVIEGEVVSK